MSKLNISTKALKDLTINEQIITSINYDLSKDIF